MPQKFSYHVVYILSSFSDIGVCTCNYDSWSINIRDIIDATYMHGFACADMHASSIHFYGFTALPAANILDIKSCSPSAHSANWFKVKKQSKKVHAQYVHTPYSLYIYTIRLIFF